jgi:D-threo-aldose 1-dehydrogenase
MSISSVNNQEDIDMSKRALESRPLGRTAIRLPVLGFGTAPLGNLYEPIEESAARLTLETALAAGIRYFDTAPFYGFGLSEVRLGSTLGDREQARAVLLSTKVGRVLTPLPETAVEANRHGFVQSLPNTATFDYSYDGVMRSFDASLQRLRVSSVAVLLAHDLGRLTHGSEHASRMRDFLDGGYRAMQALRTEGRIGAIGIGVNEIEVCQELLQRVELDCLLLAGRYTLLEQGAVESLLPECLRRRVSVIIGGPFNSGVLVESEAIDRAPHYNYAPAAASIVQRVRRLREICTAHGVPIGAAALQFPLGHAAVVSVIPGMRSAEQVHEAIRFMDTPIPAPLWDELRHAGLLNAAAPHPLPGIGA